VPRLILASQSPRRQQFLRELGLTFDILVAGIDETPRPGEMPVILARRLAEEKAQAVAGSLSADAPPALIIAADTVVALDAQLLGKPASAAEATAMLASLRGRPHSVHSGVSVLSIQEGRQSTRVNSTRVTMRAYTDAEIAAYVASGDPLDKAGAYAIQHPVFAPVARLEGCLSGVMGLPLGDLRDLLAEFGVEIGRPLAPVCEQYSDRFRCCTL
jgi:septum formation protein